MVSRREKINLLLDILPESSVDPSPTRELERTGEDNTTRSRSSRQAVLGDNKIRGKGDHQREAGFKTGHSNQNYPSTKILPNNVIMIHIDDEKIRGTVEEDEGYYYSSFDTDCDERVFTSHQQVSQPVILKGEPKLRDKNDSPETDNLIEEVIVSNPKSITKVYIPPAVEKDNLSVDTSPIYSTVLPKNSRQSMKGSSDPKSVRLFVKSSDKYTARVTHTQATETPRKASSSVVDNSVVRVTSPLSNISFDSGTSSPTQHHLVVIAIDLGTTYSGCAFSFANNPDNIYVINKWEDDDPFMENQKTPTVLLLNPQGEFHSYGFKARDSYHNLDAKDSQEWYYFDKFKMVLHSDTTLNRETPLFAVNGKTFPAIKVFYYALKYFGEKALEQISLYSGTTLLNDEVRWVITVPAIWRQPAKQFIRESAYMAGLGNPDIPDQLLIALEPEAAAIYCRRLRTNQLVSERCVDNISISSLPYGNPSASTYVMNDTQPGTKYMVVDSGGGTVDITVHEIAGSGGKLKELYKATGGPHGGIGVDLGFEDLMSAIFGQCFMTKFRTQYPSAYVQLMVYFESKKRNANPKDTKPLNINLPFAFIHFFEKQRKTKVENIVKQYGNPNITYSNSQGMLRITIAEMMKLFQPVVEKIKEHIKNILSQPSVENIQFLFLVGGFGDSPVLQSEIRKEFGSRLRVIIPHGVCLATLKGAVSYGADPSLISVRRSRLTYGVGVLNKFVPGEHPTDKFILKNGTEWCLDIFDKFVEVDQSIGVGETILRCYTPANPNQTSIVLNIYSSDRENVKFVTEPGVIRCGSLKMDLSHSMYLSDVEHREIQVRMVFGDTEIRCSALDKMTGRNVRAHVDFLGS